MRQFYGEVITGPRNGFLSMVTDGETHFEIQPLGNPADRERYTRENAQWLAVAQGRRVPVYRAQCDLRPAVGPRTGALLRR